MKIIYKILTVNILLSPIFAHGISESDKHSIIQGSLIDYMMLGAKHMITGYDHILFLIGVIFFLNKFTDIIKFVTVFTIGHSLTLIFATLYGITANYYLIDAVIAFSVIYKGFENLDGFKKIISIPPPNLILMIFIFGLIHGFGLSTRLQQIDLGTNNLILSILSFNLGVEFGQITALAIVYPILLLMRGNYFNILSKICNSGLIIAGIYLLVFQLNSFFYDQHIHDNQHNKHLHENKHHHEHIIKDHTHDKKHNHHSKTKDN